MPIFKVICLVTDAKVLISQCYSMLLRKYLDGYPTKARENWEWDAGTNVGWSKGDALQALVSSSLIPSQKLSQLYIILRAHRTPTRLHAMGLLTDPICGRCKRDRGDLIHLIWRCPKLHRYWTNVLEILNGVFQSTIPLDLDIACQASHLISYLTSTQGWCLTGLSSKLVNYVSCFGSLPILPHIKCG